MCDDSLNPCFDVNSFEPRLLTAAEATLDFRSLTVKALRPQLLDATCPFPLVENIRKKRSLPIVVALGIRSPAKSKEPIGLLLARVDQNTNEEDLQWTSVLSILSIVVKKNWRRKGVAKSLLKSTIKLSKNAGFTGVIIDHPIRTGAEEALKRLFSKAEGWQLLNESILVNFDFDSLEISDLYQRFQRVTRRQQQQWGWHVEKYPEPLSEALKSRLRDPDLPHWARPIDLSNFSRDYKFTPCCRTLLVGNEVVGWLIVYQVGEDLIRFGKLWVDPLWQKRGGFIALVADAVKDLRSPYLCRGECGMASFSSIKRGCCKFASQNKVMKRFSENHFRPVSTHWVEVERVGIRLNRL